MSVSLANFKNWIFIFLTKFLLLLSVVFCTVSVSNLGKHFLTRAYCQTQTTVFNIPPPLPWDFPRFSSSNIISHLINKDKVICVHAFIGCQYILPGPVHMENIVSIGGKKKVSTSVNWLLKCIQWTIFLTINSNLKQHLLTRKKCQYKKNLPTMKTLS